jgi:hypothetical protein
MVNRKRVHRIYREENLAIRTKTPKRRRAAVVREERVLPTAPNQSWAMDFMHDVLADGTKIRLLTIVDSFSRESLPLEVGAGFKSTEVVGCCDDSSPTAAHRSVSPVTTAPNLYPCSSTNGPTGIASSSTSRAPDVRQTMLFANRSTTACAKNCSIRTGSDRSRMHAHRPQPGVPITTPITRIVRWEISHRKSTPVERRTSLNASPFLERSWRKNGETSIRRHFLVIRGVKCRDKTRNN